jgi:hypothetical protein
MARKPTKVVVIKQFTPILAEFKANAAGILPGHLLNLASATNVRVHNVAGGNAVPWFADVDNLQGSTITDTYTVNERVQVRKFRAGDEVLAILKDGENVAAGDFLESAGDGTLQKHIADASNASNLTNQIVGMSLEALDLSDSSGADPTDRLWIEIV